MWIKIDDQAAHHPKFVKVGPETSWFWLCGLTYCARYLTDGFIPDGAVPTLAAVTCPAESAQRLVDVKLWERVEGGYRVHDYLKYQPKAAAVERIRKARAEAGRQGGRRSVEARSQAKPKQDASRLPEQAVEPTSSKQQARSNPVPVPVSVSNSNRGARAEARARNSSIRRLIIEYERHFEARFGVRPDLNPGKDGAILKGLVERHGQDRVRNMLADFFDDDDPFVTRSGFTVGVFKSVFNRLLTGRSSSASGNGRMTYEDAKRVRDRSWGRCKHEPECTTYEQCIDVIRARRGVPRAGGVRPGPNGASAAVPANEAGR